MNPSSKFLPKQIIQIFLASSLWSCSQLHAADSSSPSSAAPKSQPDVLIYQGTYPGWPWVSRCPNGTLVCAWREETQHGFSAVGRLMLSQSRDDGKRGSPAVTFLDVPGVDDRNVAIQCESDLEWLVCDHKGDLHAIAGYVVEIPSTWGHHFKP